jgi:LysR family transcriptional activator of nhaA
MDWLNYHHLYYFWTVARTGSISKASAELLLAPPTISAQIKRLEDSLGETLFERSGRRLVLTDEGRIAFRYAEEIFAAGREMQDALKGRPTGRPTKLLVGIADVLPKLIVHRLLEPAFHLTAPVQLICREDPPDRLLADLATQGMDLILTDSPMSPAMRVRAFSHLLGECGVAFYASRQLAGRCRRGFPRSLDGAPVLLPTESADMRAELDLWFQAKGIRPRVVAEFDDFSLLRTFAEKGVGIFASPLVLDTETRRRHHLTRLGRAEGIRARYYGISVEKRIKNPAVVAICETARRHLFANL